jgi:hypothetical protein
MAPHVCEKLSSIQELSMRHLGSIVATGFVVLLAATVAPADEYPGQAKTGFQYANRRECCDAALALAQRDSAAVCERAGGVPKPPAVTARGRCDPEQRRGADGLPVFACTATVNVPCDL